MSSRKYIASELNFKSLNQINKFYVSIRVIETLQKLTDHYWGYFLIYLTNHGFHATPFVFDIGSTQKGDEREIQHGTCCAS